MDEINPLTFLPLLFVAAWCGISFLVSRFSGWAALAERFRQVGAFTGTRWKFQSGQMRWRSNYGNCLTVGADPFGLFLSVAFILRPGHPPLYIPWHEVALEGKGEVLWFRYVELRLGRELSIPLRIHQRLAERLEEAAGSSWPPAQPSEQPPWTRSTDKPVN